MPMRRDDLTSRVHRKEEVKMARISDKGSKEAVSWVGMEVSGDLGCLEACRTLRAAPPPGEGGGADQVAVWTPLTLEHLIEKNTTETRGDTVLLLPIKEVTVNSKGQLHGVYGSFDFVWFSNRFTVVRFDPQ